MDHNRTTLIACAVVIEELLAILPPGMGYQVLDFGLHLSPAKLNTSLQNAIDEASAQADTILLGYGLCSMAVVGLRANNCTLVIPRVDDCIAIFLGSSRAYLQQFHSEPGTYYLTKGWIEVGDTPFQEYQCLVERYGRERADHMMELMLNNYSRLAYIDTGCKDRERYRRDARQIASQFNLRFEELAGSNALIKKMLTGSWDEDFVVIEPGHTVTYTQFVAGRPGGNATGYGG